MKKFITIIAIAVLSLAYCNAQKYTTADVKGITESFINTLLNDDIKMTLEFFDPAYVAEQHDNFLEGRTEQFVSEFLAGSYKKGFYFVNPKINEIKSIKIKKCVCKIDKGDIYSIVEVLLDTGVKYKVQLDMVIIENGDLCFIGAVG